MDGLYLPVADVDPAALLRVNLTYLWRHGRLPDLSGPTRFTELVQRRKLYDRDPRLPIMADKVGMKAIVAERLGRDWIVPMLWSGSRLPERPFVRHPVVVKARHGCNQNAFVRGDADWQRAGTQAKRWLRAPYGVWLDEWLYAHIPRGVLIEPFIGAGAALPIDYKFYVFGGHATHVQVHLARGERHRWIVHDRDWSRLSRHDAAVPRPSALGAMIAAAEELGRGFDFVRVDFYQPASQPLFGEVCFYPGSGLDPFDPPWLDAEMGRLWMRAAQVASVPVPLVVGERALA